MTFLQPIVDECSTKIQVTITRSTNGSLHTWVQDPDSGKTGGAVDPCFCSGECRRQDKIERRRAKAEKYCRLWHRPLRDEHMRLRAIPPKRKWPTKTFLPYGKTDADIPILKEAKAEYAKLQ